MVDAPSQASAAPDRLRLESLRYAVADEAVHYIAIMRTFTSGMSGLLSDQSAAEVAARLAGEGVDLDADTVDARLSYLVEHGNLARSPRETDARSIREYLTNRSRYQLTQRGELVHRQVEELLAASDTAREVSSEMLGGLLAGLRELSSYDDQSLARLEPDVVARAISTLFAQFERLVESTRDFYTYLSQVLSRYDLDRAEFQAFKVALLDYLQRFVDEVSRHMPQIADKLRALSPRVPALVARANVGQRLVGLDGQVARRTRGLDPTDWEGLSAWFVGEPGRDSDAAEVRILATRAMRALLANLRRIAATREREVSRYAELVRLAGWFDRADDETAHALWAAAFGLYPCRHLSFVADEPEPVPTTASWWRSPVAEVPVSLRTSGDRMFRGPAGRREDFAAAKAARLAEREAAERARQAALAELSAHRGRLGRIRCSDEARAVLLDLYGRALADAGGPLGSGKTAAAEAAGAGFRVVLRRDAEASTTIVSPAGRLEIVDAVIEIESTADMSQDVTA
jgi:uncharacterized protein (TIGR02677 family)